ncbi:capsular polysaccharide biosynthesis protein [Ciceribacter sp. L1K23]|nr:capsular polysaccharide biosynthesis protein [Ciceribacter sp. L1K23]
MGLAMPQTMFRKHFAEAMLSNPESRILTWGYRAKPWVYDFAREHGVPLTYCEDGFIRSTGLGNERQQPLSLCFDRQGLYFDATRPSDLETLLQNYDFDADRQLMERAAICRDKLISMGLSKYNFAPPFDVEAVYGRKDRRRILILGQVETDASIKYGCERPIDNNDVVRLAKAENPDAQIIYKPHPDVLFGSRQKVSEPDEVKDIATIVYDRISLPDSLRTVDHVYTITSLGGFEALLRDIPVTTLGCPFYAGWGVTDDRQPCHRRTRKLTVLQVFAAAYMLYPTYRDPFTHERIDIEQAIDLMLELLAGRRAGTDKTPTAAVAVTAA